MNHTLVDQVVNAVLYEGYMLYPYRPSSVKNRQRWAFGGVCPQSHSLASAGTEPWNMQAEGLLQGQPHTPLHVRVRFLHLLERRVGELAQPLSTWPAEAPALRFVEALSIGDKVVHAWQEAVEREVATPELTLGDLVGQPWRQAFAFPASSHVEPLRGPGGDLVGALVRRQQAIEGAVEVFVEQLEAGLFKVTARILNLTSLEGASGLSRDEALLFSFVSTHTILHAREGAFVSLLDPPERWSAAAAACRNVGVWPVLVGEEGEQDTMLASPIILYDYPQVAPESPGDLFDATEIDEILTLRILTMTSAEKNEMSAADERGRALLERTEALARDQLLKLHGTVRGLRPVAGREDHE